MLVTISVYVVDDHDVFAFLTHSLVPSTDAVKNMYCFVVE